MIFIHYGILLPFFPKSKLHNGVPEVCRPGEDQTSQSGADYTTASIGLMLIVSGVKFPSVETPRTLRQQKGLDAGPEEYMLKSMIEICARVETSGRFLFESLVADAPCNELPFGEDRTRGRL